MAEAARPFAARSRGTLAAALTLAALALLATAPAASAGHKVSGFIGGPPGAGAGEFNGGNAGLAGIAVNRSTGQVYVADGRVQLPGSGTPQGRTRIQRFDAAGNFQRMWGGGVRTGDAVPEFCTVADLVCQAGRLGFGNEAHSNVSTSIKPTPGGVFADVTYVTVSQANGHLYAFDRGRVQEFDADGNFVRAWGWNVASPESPQNIPVNEVQKITRNVPSGTFKVGWPNQTTATLNIPHNATAQEVEDALTESGHVLAAIDIGPENVEVTGPAGGPWLVEFVGDLADTNVVQLHRVEGAGADGSVTIETVVDGGAYEVCLAFCQGAQNGHASAVVPSGGNSTIFRDPTAGTLVGQFSKAGTDGDGIAVSPIDGDVFVQDPRNRRIQRFNSDGTLDADPVIGSSAQFAADQPSALAIDSRGILYAADSQNSGEIERYDTQANAFLAPIPAPPLLPGSTIDMVATPDTDGAGTDVDRLYVLRDPSSGDTVIQQLDAPGEVAPPAAVAETHGEGAFGTNTALPGLDVAPGANPANPAQNTFYVSSTAGAAGHGFYILDAAGTGLDFSASEGPVKNIGPHQADLTATVDPDGGIATFRFEYSADGVDWIVPAAKVVKGASQAVTQTTTGLAANTLYQARLSARKVLGPDDVLSHEGEAFFFKTAPAPPTAITRPTHSFTDTSATLVAEVNPNGTGTEYRFQYGTSTSYGKSTPLQSAGSGTGPKALQQLLGGLQPGTTYHYRVIAESPQGKASGADRTFTTRPAFEGFAERAYEQATPPFKSNPGLDVDYRLNANGGFSRAAATGPDGAVLFSGWVPLPGTGSGSTIRGQARLYYSASREGGRWVARFSSGLQGSRPGGSGGFGQGFIRPPVEAFGAANLSRSVFDTGNGMTEDEPNPVPGTYLHDALLGTNALVAPESAGGAAARTTGVQDADAELNRIIVRASPDLTGDPGISPGGTIGKVYEWVEGAVRLVSVRPDGTPFAESAIAGGPGLLAGDASFTVASVHREERILSSDGRHIFFSAPLGVVNPSPNGVTATKVYRRSDGTTTTLVSPSKRTPADPLGERAKLYKTASADGDRVFFTSAQQLTDDANTGPNREGVELYRYEVSTDTLVAISAESNTFNGARVAGILGASEDGKWVYYVARGQVLAGRGVVGQPNLYAWRDDGSAKGETRFIATLAGGDGANFSAQKFHRTSRVSDDGATAIFQSTAPLTGYQGNGNAQVYVYEADADGGRGALGCASCRPDGAPADAGSFVPISAEALVYSRDQTGALSDDGRRVFFYSDEDLLPGDANGKRDVYLWEGGRLELISTGKSPADSQFGGASPSGDDAHFYTREQLVGQDFDDMYDIYDARVGGGLASQNAPPPDEPCQGDECKPAATALPPPLSAPLSATGAPEGNYTPPLAVAKLSAQQRRSLALRGRATVSVRVDRPGRLTVRALRGKRSVIARATKFVPRAMTTGVVLRLDRGARRALDRRGRLDLRLEAHFAGESAVASFSLRRANSDRRRAR